MAKIYTGIPETVRSIEQLSDGRMQTAASQRNAEPIFKTIAPYVPLDGLVLEIASGTGQHIAALAGLHESTTWQPSEITPERMVSIEAWRAHAKVTNLRAPITLNASGSWGGVKEAPSLIYVVNLFHLITRDDAMRVIANVADALTAGGHFFIYGPFRVGGKFRSEGDAAFHTKLIAQDADTGYKDLEWMRDVFSQNGLTHAATHEMPANNLVIVGQKPL